MSEIKKKSNSEKTQSEEKKKILKNDLLAYFIIFVNGVFVIGGFESLSYVSKFLLILSLLLSIAVFKCWFDIYLLPKLSKNLTETSFVEIKKISNGKLRLLIPLTMFSWIISIAVTI